MSMAKNSILLHQTLLQLCTESNAVSTAWCVDYGYWYRACTIDKELNVGAQDWHGLTVDVKCNYNYGILKQKIYNDIQKYY